MPYPRRHIGGKPFLHMSKPNLFSKAALLQQAKKNNIIGRWSMSKSELMKALLVVSGGGGGDMLPEADMSKDLLYSPVDEKTDMTDYFRILFEKHNIHNASDALRFLGITERHVDALNASENELSKCHYGLCNLNNKLLKKYGFTSVEHYIDIRVRYMLYVFTQDFVFTNGYGMSLEGLIEEWGITDHLTDDRLKSVDGHLIAFLKTYPIHSFQKTK